MIRAGVEPTVAADLAGLPGIRFAGATPVSLREKT
nr:MAG TPA: RNA recognition motif protein [Bacteriophage sp.]